VKTNIQISTVTIKKAKFLSISFDNKIGNDVARGYNHRHINIFLMSMDTIAWKKYINMRYSLRNVQYKIVMGVPPTNTTLVK